MKTTPGARGDGPSPIQSRRMSSTSAAGKGVALVPPTQQYRRLTSHPRRLPRSRPPPVSGSGRPPSAASVDVVPSYSHRRRVLLGGAALLASTPLIGTGAGDAAEAAVGARPQALYLALRQRLRTRRSTHGEGVAAVAPQIHAHDRNPTPPVAPVGIKRGMSSLLRQPLRHGSGVQVSHPGSFRSRRAMSVAQINPGLGSEPPPAQPVRYWDERAPADWMDVHVVYIVYTRSHISTPIRSRARDTGPMVDARAVRHKRPTATFAIASTEGQACTLTQLLSAHSHVRGRRLSVPGVRVRPAALRRGDGRGCGLSRRRHPGRTGDVRSRSNLVRQAAAHILEELQAHAGWRAVPRRRVRVPDDCCHNNNADTILPLSAKWQHFEVALLSISSWLPPTRARTRAWA